MDKRVIVKNHFTKLAKVGTHVHNTIGHSHYLQDDVYENDCYFFLLWMTSSFSNISVFEY